MNSSFILHQSKIQNDSSAQACDKIDGRGDDGRPENEGQQRMAQRGLPEFRCRESRVGDLISHPDRERQIGEVPKIRLFGTLKDDAAVHIAVIEFRVPQHVETVHRRPGEHDAEQTKSDRPEAAYMSRQHQRDSPDADQACHKDKKIDRRILDIFLLRNPLGFRAIMRMKILPQQIQQNDCCTVPTDQRGQFPTQPESAGQPDARTDRSGNQEARPFFAHIPSGFRLIGK